MFHPLVDKLDSGLTLVRVPMPSVESLTVLTLVNTGSRYEKPAEEGIAHFLEHMVFKGTAKFEDSQVLASAVDSVGADFNAFTSKEYTGYYVKAASKHLDLALDVISDMLLTPRLRQEDIDRERQVIIEEMNMYADNPARRIGDIFDTMTFSGSGLGHDIIGTKQTVSALTTDDFSRFLQQWYGLSNVVVAIAGDDKKVADDSLIAKVGEFFSKGNHDRAKDAIKLSNYLEKDPFAQNKLKVEFKKTEQAHFIMAFPGLERDNPDRYALSLLSALLGGNMSSRLFTEIREKRGLCYYVGSDIDQYHNAGLFGGSAGVDPTRVYEAVKVMVAEFMALVDGTKPVLAQELTKAKDYVAGKMVLGLEDSDSVAHYAGLKQVLTGKIETPDEVLKKMRAVTLEEVHELAARLLKLDQIRFAVIGPYEEQTKFESLLK